MKAFGVYTMRRGALTVFLWMQVLSASTVAQTPDTIARVVGSPRYGGVASVVEELSIGELHGSPEYTFSSIVDIAVGNDSSMLIFESQFRGGASLRLYDPGGRFVRAVGRVGRGPGEYERPTAIAVLPDGEFLLMDGLNRRITVYSTIGDYVDTWSVPSYNVTTGMPDGMRVDSTGVIAIRFNSRGSSSRDTDPSEAIARIRAGGVVIDTLAEPRLPDLSPVVVTKTGQRNGRNFGVQLYGPYPPGAFWTWSPLGYFVTVVSSRYAIDFRLPPPHADADDRSAVWREGDPVISIRVDVPAVEVTSAERADQKTYLENQLRTFEGTRHDRVPDTPRVKPFLRWFRVADDGRIWVMVHTKSERYTPPQRRTPKGELMPEIGWREPNVMDVFEPDGTYVGRVQLPYDLRLVRFKGDRIWAVARDEFDVEYVKRYRVRWN